MIVQALSTVFRIPNILHYKQSVQVCREALRWMLFADLKCRRWSPRVKAMPLPSLVNCSPNFVKVDKALKMNCRFTPLHSRTPYSSPPPQDIPETF